MKKNKLVVISRTFPPQIVGSAILLSNLLNDYKGDVEAITGYYSDIKSDLAFAPPCKTYQFKVTQKYLS